MITIYKTLMKSVDDSKPAANGPFFKDRVTAEIYVGKNGIVEEIIVWDTIYEQKNGTVINRFYREFNKEEMEIIRSFFNGEIPQAQEVKS